MAISSEINFPTRWPSSFCGDVLVSVTIKPRNLVKSHRDYEVFAGLLCVKRWVPRTRGTHLHHHTPGFTGETVSWGQ